MSIEQAEAYLQKNAERFVADLVDLLKIPSVSADSAFKNDIRKAALVVEQQMQRAGLTTEIVETPGNPVVFGSRCDHPNAPTLLIYGHYDVQPPDPLELWTTPAFEPTVRDGKIYARGATDDKGQMLTHIKAIEAWTQAVGALPINVKIIVEGEEEVGSKNLDDFLEANREKLNCDVIVVSDTSQYAPGIPAITYGLRGIIACEVRLRGPGKDLHSGIFGGSITNPINALAKLVASLHDDQGRVQIPGFYDDVTELTAEERAQFAALPFNESDFYASVGVTAGWGETGYSSTERRWARPTCDVNGITGGYQGEGPKTIIPSWARAKITCRLVPNQDPDKIIQSLEAFLTTQLRPGIECQFVSDHGAGGLVFDTSSKYMAAAKKAIAVAFGREPVFIREGGSIPIVKTFQRILGVDTLLLGWGQNTDNLHSPNEHFLLADYQRGIHASARLIGELGAAKS
jgi:acetylornithine deacetylase/succinyl-diaminopimelate desuccinylase-like protein